MIVLILHFCYAVPMVTVSNLEVSRTQNNKSLLAQWEKLESERPVGEIVVYQIEYRNKGKDIIMTARIAATYDFFSILELEDASAYEVHCVCNNYAKLSSCTVHVACTCTGTLLVCINWNNGYFPIPCTMFFFFSLWPVYLYLVVTW